MQRAAALLLSTATLLAGCSSTGGDAQLPDTVVLRTSNSTVWTTEQSMAAAAAAEAAKVQAVQAAQAAQAARTRAAPAPVPQSRVAPVQAAPQPVADALPARQAEMQRIVYFGFDRFDIHDEFKAMLERRARALRGTPQQGLVAEGHADARGGREYNLALGQKRAEAVVRALALLGVQEAQLEAVSFGDTRPAVEGSDEQTWAQNRRAELKDR